jgi:hypothetical protein
MHHIRERLTVNDKLREVLEGVYKRSSIRLVARILRQRPPANQLGIKLAQLIESELQPP